MSINEKISENLEKIRLAVAGFRRHDEVDAYQMIEPVEKLLRKSYSRIKGKEENKVKKFYESLTAETNKFIQILKETTQNQNYETLASDMEQIRQELNNFNKSIDYLIQEGLFKEEKEEVQQPIPVQSQAQQLPSAPKKKKASASHHPKASSVPVRKTLTQKYFVDDGENPDEKETLLNKNTEVVIKISAENPENGDMILQYYLANKNAFRQKDDRVWFKKISDKLSGKKKTFSYQQVFRFMDWKPLFLEKDMPQEFLDLAKNIFGVPNEGNTQDDGLLLCIRQDSLQIKFKPYGERTSNQLKSEFSDETQSSVILMKKDFCKIGDEFSCHYQDSISFYHTFRHVRSELEGKEVLVRMKIDLKLK